MKIWMMTRECKFKETLISRNKGSLLEREMKNPPLLKLKRKMRMMMRCICRRWWNSKKRVKKRLPRKEKRSLEKLRLKLIRWRQIDKIKRLSKRLLKSLIDKLNKIRTMKITLIIVRLKSLMRMKTKMKMRVREKEIMRFRKTKRSLQRLTNKWGKLISNRCSCKWCKIRPPIRTNLSEKERLLQKRRKLDQLLPSRAGKRVFLLQWVDDQCLHQLEKRSSESDPRVKIINCWGSKCWWQPFKLSSNKNKPILSNTALNS